MNRLCEKGGGTCCRDHTISETTPRLRARDSFMEELFMSKYEDLGGADPRTADGTITIVQRDVVYTAVAIIPSSVSAKALDRFCAAIREFGFAHDHQSFSVTYDTTHQTVLAAFSEREPDFTDTLQRFLEYLRQSRVMKNPLIVDLTHVWWR